MSVLVSGFGVFGMVLVGGLQVVVALVGVVVDFVCFGGLMAHLEGWVGSFVHPKKTALNPNSHDFGYFFSFICQKGQLLMDFPSDAKANPFHFQKKKKMFFVFKKKQNS